VQNYNFSFKSLHEEIAFFRDIAVQSILMPEFDINLYTQVNEDVDVLEDFSIETDGGFHLMVYNDDVNTFEWVIQSLVEICKHTFEQAEQCAIYIHFKGKYAVKHGNEDELIPMKEALHDRGISAAVEKTA
jgi:ATP-dependent Clp protease adaptor protein ClpS